MKAICSWDGDHVRQIVALTVSADWSREIQAFRVYETLKVCGAVNAARLKHCTFSSLPSSSKRGSVDLPLDYTAYMLAGLIPWLAFQKSLLKASTVAHANLRRVKAAQG